LVAGVSAGIALVGVAAVRSGHRPRSPTAASGPVAMWTMPRLETLPPPRTCPSRALGLVVLRVYLLVAVVGVLVKVVQLALAG